MNVQFCFQNFYEKVEQLAVMFLIIIKIIIAFFRVAAINQNGQRMHLINN